MIIDFGLRKGDSVTVPVEWANVIRDLPNGQPVDGFVRSVNGPVTTVETKLCDFAIATVTVRKWKN